MKTSRILIFALLALCSAASAAAPYQDRFVWVFGYGLSKDSDVTEIDKLLETAAQHGINGAVLSASLDSLTQKTPDYFRRLDAVAKTCERLHIELIPSVFSVGYGSPALSFNKMLAEGLPVTDAPFLVQGDSARIVPDESIKIPNGGFEDFRANNRLSGFGFYDQPGEISFVDTDVKHSGKASLRLENFKANPHGHGRINLKVKLQPHRCYRVSLWVKTENLSPTNALRVMALAKGDRELAPRSFNVPATTDWRKLSMLVNSMDNGEITLYAGMWGGQSGKLWFDDWSIEEVGPINVLHRPGTPVTVRSEDGATTFTEGKDYAPLEDRNFAHYRPDHDAATLRILPNSRIKTGQTLKVSWYHPMLIHDSQVSVCMAEPELYEIMDREAKALSDHLHPKRVLLNMDEIRMGGTCEACKGKDMAQLLGQCITRQEEILRKHIPGVRVYVWSDMLDPNHNAHDNYYLVQGSFANSWKYVPRDLVMAVWGGEPRKKSLKFFEAEGFSTLVACYYDAPNLDDVKGWINLAKDTKNVRGFMYTPWTRNYQLLGAFGDLIGKDK
jgi:hypothetical protein